MRFYHGTSDKLPIGSILLPPVQTYVKREFWRIKFTNKVFLTASLKSAEYYAKKAVEKYGGNPVIYEAEPIDGFERIKGEDYITNCAYIIHKRSLK